LHSLLLFQKKNHCEHSTICLLVFNESFHLQDFKNDRSASLLFGVFHSSLDGCVKTREHQILHFGIEPKTYPVLHDFHDSLKNVLVCIGEADMAIDAVHVVRERRRSFARLVLSRAEISPAKQQPNLMDLLPLLEITVRKQEFVSRGDLSPDQNK